MAVVINEFEAAGAAPETAPTAAAAVTPRTKLADSQRTLRALAARAARIRGH